MSNYSPIISYGPKDALIHGDPNKVIKGVQIDAELAAISTAISSKYDAAGLAASTTTFTQPQTFSNTVTFNGVVTMTAASSNIIAGRFLSASGNTAVTPSGTPVSILAMGSGVGIFLVFATIGASGDAANYNAIAICSINGSTAKATTLQSAPLMSITVTGTTIQAAQSSGGAQPIAWYYTRLA